MHCGHIRSRHRSRLLNLLLQGEKQDAAVCRQELFKIESYVEMALNYLRFEEMSNDLVLER